MGQQLRLHCPGFPMSFISKNMLAVIGHVLNLEHAAVCSDLGPEGWKPLTAKLPQVPGNGATRNRMQSFLFLCQ